MSFPSDRALERARVSSTKLMLMNVLSAHWTVCSLDGVRPALGGGPSLLCAFSNRVAELSVALSGARSVCLGALEIRSGRQNDKCISFSFCEA